MKKRDLSRANGRHVASLAWSRARPCPPQSRGRPRNKLVYIVSCGQRVPIGILLRMVVDRAIPGLLEDRGLSSWRRCPALERPSLRSVFCTAELNQGACDENKNDHIGRGVRHRELLGRCSWRSPSRKRNSSPKRPICGSADVASHAVYPQRALPNTRHGNSQRSWRGQ